MDSDKIYSIIKNSGLDAQFNVQVESEDLSMLKITKGDLESVDTFISEVASISCIYKNRLSIINASITSYDEISKFIVDAYKLAKNGSVDCQSRVAWKKHREIKNPFSSRIKKVDVPEIETKLYSAIKKVSSLGNVYSINAWLMYSSSIIHAANSYGIRGDWKNSYSSISSHVVAKDGAEQASSSKSYDAMDPYSLDIDNAFTTAATEAKNLLYAKRAPTFKGDLLLSPEASMSIIQYLASAMSGPEVYKKLSFLSGKLGKVIASDLIDLREIINVKNSPFNISFDNELMPTSTKTLVKDGVLKTYLHNIYSAEKMSQEPTGNAFHNGIGTTNLVLKPGKNSEEELLSRIKRGVYLLDTGDSPNMSTGDLSAMVSEGYYVENGQKKYPLKETVVGINMLNMMKNVVGVGSKSVGLGGIFSPAMLVSGVQISGK
ncbi:MAG: TldD/PmbA family protein [Candidatus Parvarchaeota archaeon]|nr:TldD/PmbA family protein [Candidatus Parvarchaeota archaeon]